MRIAICDDEEVQRKMLKKYLEEWAERNEVILKIELFPNGENFLFLWEDDKDYDLLILDIEVVIELFLVFFNEESNSDFVIKFSNNLID